MGSLNQKLNDLCSTGAFGNEVIRQVTKNTLRNDSSMISFDLHYHSLVPKVVKL